MTRQRHCLVKTLLAAGVVAAAAGAAKATVIASDSFLTTATATTGFYTAGSVQGQTATNGTTGYFTGTAAGSQVPGWAAGTTADTAQVGGISNPLVVNPASSNDGSLLVAGNANARVQYRDLASTTPPASQNYWFSTVVRESATAYTGTVYAGLGPSQAAGNFGGIPTTGYDVGFLNGAITLFYNNGGASLTTQTLLASPTAGTAYFVEVHQGGSGIGATSLTSLVYGPTGNLFERPSGGDRHGEPRRPGRLPDVRQCEFQRRLRR